MEHITDQIKDYLKIEEVAKKWDISPRRVQALCSAGKIAGAIRLGRDWMIPQDAKRPTDGRTKEGRREQQDLKNTNLPFPRKTPFLHMTDLYNSSGSAEASIEKLSGNRNAQMLFAAEIAYSRGDIDEVYDRAKFLLNDHSDLYTTLSAGMLMALCAIWRGDLTMWRRSKVFLADAPAENDIERDIIAFSITAVDSMLYDVELFPEWFKIGCFEPLHKDSLPAAKVFYAKYLYATAYSVATKQIQVEGLSGLTLMTMLPYAIEPMVSQAVADNSVIAEAYLRFICATIYHYCGNNAQAIRHIDRALELVLPDKLYGLISEYCRVIGPLIEKRLNLISPEAYAEVKKLSKIYIQGWTKLSSRVLGKNLITTLSVREREVARMAAFGMQNSEIAEKLHMSLSGVKQAIRIVSEKSGVGRDEFAAIL